MVRIICPLFKKLLYLTLFTLYHIDQSAPNLGKIFMSNRIWMSLIMGPIGLNNWSYLLLNLEIFVYSLQINQSAPNLVTIYMSIRSQTSLIMGHVILGQSVLSAFEIEK